MDVLLKLALSQLETQYGEKIFHAALVNWIYGDIATKMTELENL